MNSSQSIQDVECAPDEKGWRASLELEICHRGPRSVVSRSSQNGPLTIQSPFYPEDEVCHLYLLHPPAGIVGGDRLRLNVMAKNHGSCLITTPGATKFYKSNGQFAHQRQIFSVSDDASLEWLPQETIYFPDAKAELSTTVNLEGHAQFIGWEIHCLGLPANEKDFGCGSARITVSVYRDKKAVLLESLKISNQKKKFQSAFLQNQPVFGSLVATGGTAENLDLLREMMPELGSGIGAATIVDDLIVIRYLGASTNEARKLFIESWKILRPRVIGREAVLPRIWAT